MSSLAPLMRALVRQMREHGYEKNYTRAIIEGLDTSAEARAARASNQGFGSDLFHGSPRTDLTLLRRLHGAREQKAEMLGEERGFNSLGVWSSNRGDDAGAGMYVPKNGGAVYPVRSRAQRPFVIHGRPEWNNPDQAFQRLGRFISKLTADQGSPAWQNRDMKPVRKWLSEHGYDSLVLRNTYGDSRKGMPPQDMYIDLDDGNIRSRHAMFNPKRQNKRDILASTVLAALLSQLRDEESA